MIDDDLHAILRDLWGLTFGRGLGAPDGATKTPEWLATVDISGPRPATLLIRCPEKLLREAAAFCFDVAPEKASDADQIDVLGEVASVASGNLMAVLPQGSWPGLPKVRRGGRPQEGAQLAHAAFEGGFEARLVSRAPADTRSSELEAGH